MRSLNDAPVARTVVALAWLGLLPGTAHSQPPEGPGFREQMSIMEQVYHSKGRDVPPGYTIDRSLFSYVDTLPEEFGRELAKLGPDDRWLDIGAGQGRALLDYYTPEKDMSAEEERKWCKKRAASVAISIEDRRTPRWHLTIEKLEPGKMKYLAGKRLHDYSREELGQFDIITDVGGGFTYTSDLSQFMEKALALLEDDGQFFGVLQNVQSEAGANEPSETGSPFLTEIVNSDGSRVKICSWLKSIRCVKVRCLHKKDWDPPIEVYHVKRVCPQIKVPPLTAVHYEAGTPPERRFKLGKPLPGATTEK